MFSKFSTNKKFAVALAASTALYASIGLGIGAICDKIANNKRANRADVEQGKVK